MNKKNNKALSEIVSYVLLIVIVLSLASGVYVWMKTYLPSQNPREDCPEEVSLFIKDYTCNNNSRTIELVIENKGLFNVNGFFARASNDSTISPTIMLNSLDAEFGLSIPGRYDLNESLKPGESLNSRLSYSNSYPLKIIQIQPFKKGKKDIFLCKAITEIVIEDSTCS